MIFGFRRTTRLKLTPLVALVVAVPIFINPFFIIPAALIMCYWLPAALGDYSKRLVIGPDFIRKEGIFGTVSLEKSKLTSCHYVLVQPLVAGALDMFFLQLQDDSGHKLRIHRYGWGSERARLFQELKQWLANSPVDVNAEAERFLRDQ